MTVLTTLAQARRWATTVLPLYRDGSLSGPQRRRLVEATFLLTRAAWKRWSRAHAPTSPFLVPVWNAPGTAVILRCATRADEAGLVHPEISGSAGPGHPYVSLGVPAMALNLPPALTTAFHDGRLSEALQEVDGPMHWAVCQPWRQWLAERGGDWAQEWEAVQRAEQLERDLPAPTLSAPRSHARRL